MTSVRTQVVLSNAVHQRALGGQVQSEAKKVFFDYVDPEDGSIKCSDTQATVYQNIRRHTGTRRLTLRHKARTNSEYWEVKSP